MIGSLLSEKNAIKASGLNQFMITPGIYECFQPLFIINREVSSDVLMTVA